MSHAVGNPSFRVICNFMTVSYNKDFPNKRGVVDALKEFHKKSNNSTNITDKEWSNAFHQAHDVLEIMGLKHKKGDKRTYYFRDEQVKFLFD